MKKFIWIYLITVLCISAQGQTSHQSKYNLTGTWKLNTGETVVITQSGNNVTAVFSPPIKCHDDQRTTLFISPMEFTSFTGRDTTVSLGSDQFWACTRDERLIKDCGVSAVWVTRFRAEVSSDGSMITGQRFAEGWGYDIQDGKFVNCHLDSKYDGWKDFTLTRANRKCDDFQRAYDQKKGLLDAHDAQMDVIANQYNELYDRFAARAAEANPLIQNARSEWSQSIYGNWLSDMFNSMVVPMPPSAVSLPITALQNVVGFFSYLYETHNATLEEVRTWAQNQPAGTTTYLLRLMDYLIEMKGIANEMYTLKNQYDDMQEHREPFERAAKDAKAELDACLGAQ
jgi:hypothetical protein